MLYLLQVYVLVIAVVAIPLLLLYVFALLPRLTVAVKRDVRRPLRPTLETGTASPSIRAHVQKVDMLKERALDVLVFLTLLISIASVAIVDVWGLAKLWHVVFGFL